MERRDFLKGVIASGLAGGGAIATLEKAVAGVSDEPAAPVCPGNEARRVRFWGNEDRSSTCEEINHRREEVGCIGDLWESTDCVPFENPDSSVGEGPWFCESVVSCTDFGKPLDNQQGGGISVTGHDLSLANRKLWAWSPDGKVRFGEEEITRVGQDGYWGVFGLRPGKDGIRLGTEDGSRFTDPITCDRRHLWGIVFRSVLDKFFNSEAFFSLTY